MYLVNHPRPLISISNEQRMNKGVLSQKYWSLWSSTVLRLYDYKDNRNEPLCFFSINPRMIPGILAGNLIWRQGELGHKMGSRAGGMCPHPEDWTQAIYHLNPVLARQPFSNSQAGKEDTPSPGCETGENGQGAALRECWTAPDTGPLNEANLSE